MARTLSDGTVDLIGQYLLERLAGQKLKRGQRLHTDDVRTKCEVWLGEQASIDDNAKAKPTRRSVEAAFRKLTTATPFSLVRCDVEGYKLGDLIPDDESGRERWCRRAQHARRLADREQIKHLDEVKQFARDLNAVRDVIRQLGGIVDEQEFVLGAYGDPKRNQDHWFTEFVELDVKFHLLLSEFSQSDQVNGRVIADVVQNLMFSIAPERRKKTMADVIKEHGEIVRRLREVALSSGDTVSTKPLREAFEDHEKEDFDRLAESLASSEESQSVKKVTHA